MKTEELKKYANMLIKMGVNLQPGQSLLVRATVDAAPLARNVVEAAYEAGAKQVVVDWTDEEVKRSHLQLAPEESLSVVLGGRVRDLTELLEGGAAAITIYAPKPHALRGVDANRISIDMKATNDAMSRMNDITRKSQVSWTIGVLPTPEWAQLVFPELSAEESVEKLWSCIQKATRLDQADPVAVWEAHVKQLETRTNWLNERQFARLHYTAPGTELTVDLPRNHIWVGGGIRNARGHFFLPNMPTEEVFTSPLKTGINGVVRNTLPLLYNGQTIDGFSLTFEEGRVVKATAETGEDLLNRLLDMDEGARRFGEVALVPQNSPIAEMGIVFQNTLFDENASCHFALGAAYPLCVEGGTAMSKEQLAQNGLNTSLIHVDFMIGSDELNIDAETEQGERVPLFRNGLWAI